MLNSQIEAARQLLHTEQFVAATRLCEQIAPLFETKEMWDEYALVLMIQSESQWRIGKARTALELNNKAFNLITQKLENNYPTLADCYVNFGGIYSKLANYDSAIAYFQKALDIYLLNPAKHQLDLGNCYHNIGLCFNFMGDYNRSIEYLMCGLRICEQTLGVNHPELARNYNAIGMCLVSKGDYRNAHVNYKYALELTLLPDNKKPNQLAMVYNNIGVLYVLENDFDYALHYFYKSLAIKVNLFGQEHSGIVSSYGNVGNCYKNKGNTAQALHYYQKALSLSLKVNGKKHPATALQYLNMGIGQKIQKNFDAALCAYQIALQIYRSALGKNHVQVAWSLNNIANLYVEIGDYKVGLKFFHKTLQIYRQIFGEKHPNIAFVLDNLATTYYYNDQFSTALYYYQQALTNLYPNYNNAVYLHNPLLDECSSTTVLLDVFTHKAQTLYRKSVQASNIIPVQLLASYTTYHLAIQIIDQIRCNYQAEDSKLILAETAKAVYDQAILVAWQIHCLLQNTYCKTKLETAFYQLKQINSHYPLPEPIDAIRFAFTCCEKNKATLLFTIIKDRHALQIAGITQALLTEEYNLRVEINYLEKRITEEQYKKIDEQNEAALIICKNKQFDYKQQYEALLRRFETDYPDYFLLKYQLQPVTIEQIQNTLPEGTAMLQFFVGSEFIYLYVITSSLHLSQNELGISVYQVAKPKQFEAQVMAFVKHLEIYNNRHYVKLAYALYQILLQEAIQQLPDTKIDTLLIIPDGILTKLPFEALLTQPTTAASTFNYPYLLLQYQVQYHHSATLWHYYYKRVSQLSGSLPNSYIGFAPVYSCNAAAETPIELQIEEMFFENSPTQNRSHEILKVEGFGERYTKNTNYAHLPDSANEVNCVSQLFTQQDLPAQTFLYEKATLQNFKNHVERYKYIHIAAHGEYNDKQPQYTGIPFSPDEANTLPMLYLNDTFQLQLNADLLVLSCCETGIGKQKEGEGMMALNRGFLYAGAHNIIYTLFKVLDQPTSKITQLLFWYIISGLSYKESLHLAKLSQIQNQHPPSYWSGFVLMGK